MEHTDETDVLSVCLGDNTIYVLLEHIYMIVPLTELQEIPHQDPAFEGMLNFHAELIPIYHLSKMINLPTPEYTLNSIIIICKIPQGFIGLLTTDAQNVIKLDSTLIQSQKPFPYVIGVYALEQASAWILDVGTLFKLHQQKHEVINDSSLPKD